MRAKLTVEGTPLPAAAYSLNPKLRQEWVSLRLRGAFRPPAAVPPSPRRVYYRLSYRSATVGSPPRRGTATFPALSDFSARSPTAKESVKTTELLVGPACRRSGERS